MRRVFVSCLFIALAGLCLADSTWTRPAASGPGNWNDASNWDAIPDASTADTLTSSSADLSEIWVTDSQTYGERLFHGWQSTSAVSSVLRIKNGGTLTYGTNAANDDHVFIGYTNTAKMIIDAGGTLAPRAKLYLGQVAGSSGTLDVAGTLDFTTLTHGMLVLAGNDTATGVCNVLDGGVVKVKGFGDTYNGIDQPIKDGGLLNIIGTGKVVYAGNQLIEAEAFLSRESDHVAGDGVLGNVVASYDAGLDETTITTFQFDALSVNLGADQDYTRGAVPLTLTATVVDDGVPATAVLTWSQTAGPGTATFASPNSATTDVDFDAAGVYTLRLTADNTAGGGSEVVYDELDVTVSNPTCQDVIDNNLLLAADVNGDCHVNLADVAVIAAAWMNCSNPQDAGCDWTYPVLTIVHNGQPASVIRIGQGASTTEQYAAEELQLYLEKMSGTTVPILTEGIGEIQGTEIVIGTPDTCQYVADSGLIAESSLGRDGLLIKTVDNTLILAGENPPGALYATYAFLEEHLGCRWYFPGAQGEYVPAMTTIATGQIDDTQKPAIQYRGLHPVAANTSDPEIATWMGRNRMNNISDVAFYWYEMATVAEHIKKGLYYNAGTHFSHWLGGDSLYDEHPEYFPLLDGVRVANYPSGYDPSAFQYHNYCLSDLNLVGEVADAMEDYVAQYPDVEILGLHQQDSQSWCECGPCSAMGSGLPTDRLHIFINRLVAELDSRGSLLDNRMLATQAYQMTSALPINVIPNPKVVIYYCLITHCARHDWAEECPVQDAQKDMLDGWLQYGNKLIAYTYHANLYPGFPMPMAYHSHAGMKYYKEIGVSGWYPEIAGDDPGQDPLARDPNLLWGDEWYSKKETYYTAAKTLWDSTITLEEIKDDFFPKFYGAAGPAMRNYYDALEEAWHYPGDVLYPHKWILGYDPTTGIDFLNPTLINTMNGYLADAVALSVNESDVIKGRVARDVEMFAKWEQRYDETGGVAE